MTTSDYYVDQNCGMVACWSKDSLALLSSEIPSWSGFAGVYDALELLDRSGGLVSFPAVAIQRSGVYRMDNRTSLMYN